MNWLLLYLSAMMIVNCEFNVHSKGDGSLRARHARICSSAKAKGVPWGVNSSAAVITLGSMVAGIAVPMILLSMFVELFRE